MLRSALIALLLVVGIVLPLSACVAGGGYGARLWDRQKPAESPPGALSDMTRPTPPAGQVEQIPAISPQHFRPVKVAILLPLSGKNAVLGQAMLNAAQMALFDVGYDGFQLVPRDTKGTPQGAQEAVHSALGEGAELVLGPMFSEEVKAARPFVQGAHVNMIAFSTDWNLAGGNTFIMGFLPFDQIERVTRFAAAHNIRQAGIIAPSTDYGQASASAFQAMAGRAGMQIAQIERFNPQNPGGWADAARRLAQASVNGVFLPAGGDSAKAIGNLLAQAGLPPGRARRLGTGLFDDPSLIQEPGLEGAWFAAPSPRARTAFEKRYMQSYSVPAQRLSTLAYDATALAAVLAQRGLSASDKPAFDRESITNANGFSGIDGIFRFRPDGTVERGLAILEIRRGGITLIDEAPKTFQQQPAF